MLGDGEQVAVRCVTMRGGTSKAQFLRSVDLPSDPVLRDRFILALFGSPDPRQVDGLGGADILTSKLAIIGPPTRPDADLDYTFAQVSVSEPVVTYDINCGNISAAVGVYAVQEGLVAPGQHASVVRIHNTNTGKVLVAAVPMRHGAPAVEGTCTVDGVPGSGAEIRLDYAATAGGATGRLLPTGRTRDQLDVPELGAAIEVSVVDIGNLCVVFRAEAAGLTGTEGPAAMGPDRLRQIDAVRARAAARLGLPTDGLTPIPVAVAPPAPYPRFTDGRVVRAEEVDLLARVVGGRPPTLHRAFPGTAGVCTAVAATIPGTLAAEAAAASPPLGEARLVRIGHPSGCFELRVRVSQAADGWQVDEAAYARTARRLMEGYAFVRRAALATEPEERSDVSASRSGTGKVAGAAIAAAQRSPAGSTRAALP